MTSNRKYFLLSAEIKNYNVLIDGRNFYNQPNDDLIKQCDQIKKVAIGQGDDYTTGRLLDYAFVKINCKLTTVDLKVH